MNHARLKAVLAAYGANPLHWPEEERNAVLAALAAGEELPELREAEALDRLLARVPETSPPDWLLESTLAKAAALSHAEKPAGRIFDRHWLADAWFWRPAAAALLPFALGIALGIGNNSLIFSPAETEEYWALEIEVAGFELPVEEEIWP